VTGHLYGGDRETRIVQEMLLGIGGVRLCASSASTRTCFTERRTFAFLTLELTAQLVQSERRSFAEAASIVREYCVFTRTLQWRPEMTNSILLLLPTALRPDYSRELA